jgi:hypothetical protein
VCILPEINQKDGKQAIRPNIDIGRAADNVDLGTFLEFLLISENRVNLKIDELEIDNMLKDKPKFKKTIEKYNRKKIKG